jgi:hypothetical protein
MGEEREESGSASGTAALDRSGRDVEHLGGFGDRVALHVHEHQRGTLLGWESAQRFEELAVQIVAFRWSRRLFVRLQQLLQPFGVVDRSGLA